MNGHFQRSPVLMAFWSKVARRKLKIEERNLVGIVDGTQVGACPGTVPLRAVEENIGEGVICSSCVRLNPQTWRP
jgi:hypothetical protein